MDLRTLMLVYAGILAACAAALFITWRQHPNVAGPRTWAIGSGFAAFALVILAVSNFSLKLRWVHTFALPLAWLGVVYYARGTRQFVGLVPSPVWSKIVFWLALAAMIALTALTPYGAAFRIIVTSAVFAVFCFDLVYAALRQKAHRRAPSYFIAFFFSIWGVTHVVRSVVTCFDLNRFSERPVDSIMVFVGILGGAATAMGFSMLTSQRLMDERARTLRRLESSVEHLRERFVALSGGDYATRAAMDGDDGPMKVIAQLFNETADKVGNAFAEIERQRSVLAATQESMLDGLLLIDSEARVLSANPALLSMLKLEQGHVVGRYLHDVLSEDDRALADSMLTSVASQPIQERSVRFLDRDKVPVALTINAAPHRDATGDVLGAVLVVRDDRILKETRAHLQMTGRLSAIGTVAAGVAHEINNPLAYVLANIEYSLEELQGAKGSLSKEVQEEMLRALQAAQGGGERVRKIVDDLKGFSRSSDEGVGPVQVNELLESTAAILENEIRHHAVLDLQLGDVPRVEGSEGKLGQVFLNLIHNAAQSISPGHVEQNRIRVSSRADGPNVIIEVSDTGCGISSSDRERIFDMFYTTKPVGVGTGLGLAISQRVVSELNGRIEVASTEGEGSVFRVILPASVQSQPRPFVAAPEQVTSPVRRRVLVIDDEAEVGNSARRILSKHHDVETVTSAREGILRIANTEFDVILCDVMMPDMTGMQFFEVLKERYPTLATRVTFMSGGAFSSEAEEFLEAIEQPKIFKPFSSSTLRSAVARVSPALPAADVGFAPA